MASTAYNLLSKLNWKGLATLRRPHAQEQKQDDLADFYYQQEIPKDYPLDKEIMEKLPQEFANKDLNTIEFMLKNMPQQIDEKWFERELYEKERALDIVTSKLSQKVMQNYNAFVQAMTQIHDLAIDLQTSAIICKDSRRNLAHTKEYLIIKVVQILVKYRKRQRYKEIIEHLMAIKRVKILESILKQTLEEGDYPKAIQLHLEYTTSFKELKHFAAIHQLGTSKTDSAELVKGKLISAMAEVISKFNPVNYERILVAYRLIGWQSHDAFNEMQKLFFEIVNKNTLNILMLHVVMSDPENHDERLEELKRWKFNDLCPRVKEEHFRSCLLSIFDFLCDIMSSHYQMTQWHENYTGYYIFIYNKKRSGDADENKDFLSKIKESLQKLKKTIWDDFQRKVSALLSAVKITTFKIDDFLKILDSVYQFIDIGESFSESDAFNLRGSMKQSSKQYFDGSHKARLEDLYTMLENEMWQKCPVSKDFNIMHIKEFKSFSTTASAQSIFSGKESKRATLIDQLKYGSPFRKDAQRRVIEPVQVEQPENLDDDDDDMIADDLSVSRVEEYRENKKSPLTGAVETPILTTTTINIVRFITKYLQMMQILQPISYEIFQGMCDIVEYYVYSLYNLFGKTDEEQANISGKLRFNLQRLQKQFIALPSDSSAPANQNVHTINIRLPKLSSVVSLSDPNNLYGILQSINSDHSETGLPFRTVAIESIGFLDEAMMTIKPYLQNLLPKAREKNVTDFYSGSVEILPELTRFMYKTMVAKWINWELFLTMISNMKWDTTEVGIEYSPYVDYILKEIAAISKRLTKEGKIFPQKVKNLFMEILIQYLMEMLVEGYSRARKCTNEGRVQMSLDLKNIQTGLEKQTTIKPIPGTNYVENYIKAYYLGEIDILPWCKEHPEYTLKQWLAIINVGVGQNMKKTSKQDLITALENLDKLRRRK